MRRCVLGFILLAFLFGIVVPNKTSAQQSDGSYDLIVVGATFSGIAAAINAAKFGHSVALVEEYPHIGGLMTGGLSYTDFLSFEVLGGTFKNYIQRVEQYYIHKYGANSKQVQDSHKGIHAEPHVTLRVFHEMLEEYPNITVILRHRLDKVSLEDSNGKLKKITSVTMINLIDDSLLNISGQRFIDATYEGDLAALAGVGFTVGRESREQYIEIFAGKIFFQDGKILLGSTGEKDKKVQGYNFRIIMSNDSDNRRLIEKPVNYKRGNFLPLSEVLTSGKVSHVFSENRDGIFRIQMLPNQKSDMNDIKNSPVRMALLGKNYEYPEGSAEVRKRIIREHKEHNLGMLYFVQNDPSMPEKFKEEARKWGLAKDEFTDNDNFPYRLYIREARRIIGKHILKEQDVQLQSNSIRSVLHEDAIAIGDYALNCHGESPPGPLYAHLTEGDFSFRPAPFQIPYGVLVPVEIDNLLVSVAVSATHVGFTGIRLEPTWTALGQAAGLAAHQSLEKNVVFADLDINNLQQLLHAEKAKTIYISDVETDSGFFKSAQYFGPKGFVPTLINLDTIDFKPAKRTFGLQYFEAHPFHELEPEKLMDKELANLWIDLLNLKADKLQKAGKLYENKLTRGEFLVKLYNIINP